MNLTYAVDRLYQSGWTPLAEMDMESLPDGRRFPSVLGVQAEFARAGLELCIKRNLIFNCCRASWAPAEEAENDGLKDEQSDDPLHGAVVGACEREAAVYAMAQLRESQLEAQFAQSM